MITKLMTLSALMIPPASPGQLEKPSNDLNEINLKGKVESVDEYSYI